jgi:cytochrome c-type biogenesis protein CcmH/NrfG
LAGSGDAARPGNTARPGNATRQTSSLSKTDAAAARRTARQVLNARDPSDVHQALTDGAAVGGVPVLEAAGRTVAQNCGFSYYNALNFCGSWLYPYGFYGGCQAGFAFTIGLSWGWGWGVGFGFGYPYWGCGWGWGGWGWGGYGGYYGGYGGYYGGGYYGGGGYPVYVSEPSTVYYPVIVDNSSATSEVVEGGVKQPAGKSSPGRLPAENETPVAAGNPRLADRYVALGDLYFQAGRYDRAIESYEKAILNEPNNPGLRFVISDAYFANGRYADAAQAIRAGLRADPGLVESQTDKRKIYARSADFDAQIAVLTHYLAIHPTNADGWLVLGYNHYFRGELALARSAFVKAQELGAEDTRFAAQLFLAGIEVREQELEAASKPESKSESKPASK